MRSLRFPGVTTRCDDLEKRFQEYDNGRWLHTTYIIPETI